MRVLVTGGAGYIGSHTVRLLASQGRKIVVLDNLVFGHEEAIVDPGVELVAVCDVYGPHRQKGIERSQNPDLKAYVDYRELLADKNVDAVVIATADHWHVPAGILAVRSGKDVYIEAMLESALRSAALAEEVGLRHDQIIISCKTSLRERYKQADLEALIEALIDEGVELIVVGGAAAVLHGAPTTTIM